MAEALARKAAALSYALFGKRINVTEALAHAEEIAAEIADPDTTPKAAQEAADELRYLLHECNHRIRAMRGALNGLQEAVKVFDADGVEGEKS